jgi:HEAT repeat protein
MGDKAKPALPDLIRVFKGDPDERVRSRAGMALKGVGVTEKFIPDLIDALRIPDKQMRVEAAQALWDLGPEAKAAVPALIEALQDQDEAVRVSVILTLGIMGPDAKAAIPALKRIIETDPRVRVRAQHVLRSIERGSQ